MTISERTENDILILEISGEIDASNSKEFEEKVDKAVERTGKLVLDLTGLYYVSSAGLRIFLLLQRRMKLQEKEMLLRNVNEEVMDIFNVTGFANLLNIEE